MIKTLLPCDQSTSTLASIPSSEEAHVKFKLGKVLVATSLACGSLIYAQVGTDVEKGAKDTGKATETAAKDTGKATKTGAKDTAKVTGTAVKDTRTAAKDTGKATGTAVKDTGK